jgi:hypothetical protein
VNPNHTLHATEHLLERAISREKSDHHLVREEFVWAATAGRKPGKHDPTVWKGSQECVQSARCSGRSQSAEPRGNRAYDLTVWEHMRDALQTRVPNADRIGAETPDPSDAPILARPTA